MIDSGSIPGSMLGSILSPKRSEPHRTKLLQSGRFPNLTESCRITPFITRNEGVPGSSPGVGFTENPAQRRFGGQASGLAGQMGNELGNA